MRNCAGSGCAAVKREPLSDVANAVKPEPLAGAGKGRSVNRAQPGAAVAGGRVKQEAAAVNSDSDNDLVLVSVTPPARPPYASSPDARVRVKLEPVSPPTVPDVKTEWGMQAPAGRTCGSLGAMECASASSGAAGGGRQPVSAAQRSRLNEAAAASARPGPSGGSRDVKPEDGGAPGPSCGRYSPYGGTAEGGEGAGTMRAAQLRLGFQIGSTYPGSVMGAAVRLPFAGEDNAPPTEAAVAATLAEIQAEAAAASAEKFAVVVAAARERKASDCPKVTAFTLELYTMLNDQPVCRFAYGKLCCGTHACIGCSVRPNSVCSTLHGKAA